MIAPAFQSDIPPRSMGLRVCGVLAPSAPTTKFTHAILVKFSGRSLPRGSSVWPPGLASQTNIRWWRNDRRTGPGVNYSISDQEMLRLLRIEQFFQSLRIATRFTLDRNCSKSRQRNWKPGIPAKNALAWNISCQGLRAGVYAPGSTRLGLKAFTAILF